MQDRLIAATRRPLLDEITALRAELARVTEERNEQILQRAANWGLFEGTQTRLKETARLLRELAEAVRAYGSDRESATFGTAAAAARLDECLRAAEQTRGEE